MRCPAIFLIALFIVCGVVFGQTDPAQGNKAEESAKEVTTADNSEIEKAVTLEQAAPSGLEVTRAAVCMGIDNREPQESGEKFTKDVGKVYCFSHIKGADRPLNIVHKWYYKYKLMSSIALRIKADNWRTYSYKTIAPDMVGEWKVEIVNSENDEVLQLLKFLVE